MVLSAARDPHDADLLGSVVSSSETGRRQRPEAGGRAPSIHPTPALSSSYQVTLRLHGGEDGPEWHGLTGLKIQLPNAVVYARIEATDKQPRVQPKGTHVRTATAHVEYVAAAAADTRADDNAATPRPPSQCVLPVLSG